MPAAPARRGKRVLAAVAALCVLALSAPHPCFAGRFNAALREDYLAAQVRLGRKYYRGDGVPRDDAKALRCFREAAEGGDPEGKFLMGVLYAEGRAVPQDYAEAARWYRKAAGRKHGAACFNLAILYAGGLGVPRDPGEALRWYRHAADAGHPAARVRVAAAFETGEGAPRDLETAAAWYRKAADQGNEEACLRLGALYAGGRGVPKDPAEALRWYRRAADLGSAEARFALGALHERGTGVRRDTAEALRWYRLAASAGHPQARREASRLEGSRGEPRLFGLSLARATRGEIRAALEKLGARPEREDDRYWYDTYDASELLPGSGPLVIGYAGRPERVAVLRCTFPVTLSAPSVEELAEAIEEKYGPADFERGSAARGLAEYRWNVGGVTVTLQRSRTDGPANLTYEVTETRRILDAEMSGKNAGRVRADRGALVRSVIAERVRGRRPEADEIARELAMSTRAMQRLLQSSGTSYRQLLDEVRNEHARGYLRSTSFSDGEVSFLLGFEDPNSFYRAFRSWNGMSPAEFRRRGNHDVHRLAPSR